MDILLLETPAAYIMDVAHRKECGWICFGNDALELRFLQPGDDAEDDLR